MRQARAFSNANAKCARNLICNLRSRVLLCSSNDCEHDLRKFANVCERPGTPCERTFWASGSKTLREQRGLTAGGAGAAARPVAQLPEPAGAEPAPADRRRCCSSCSRALGVDVQQFSEDEEARLIAQLRDALADRPRTASAVSHAGAARDRLADAGGGAVLIALHRRTVERPGRLEAMAADAWANARGELARARAHALRGGARLLLRAARTTSIGWTSRPRRCRPTEAPLRSAAARPCVGRSRALAARCRPGCSTSTACARRELATDAASAPLRPAQPSAAPVRTLASRAAGLPAGHAAGLARGRRD